MTAGGTDPLHPLVGNLWVPVWAVRPGSYAALAHLARCMPLWLVLHSRNGDYWKPAYASREQLGATIGVSRATVTRQLRKLTKEALLFEVQRGVEPKAARHRPPARWALDPFAADLWREKVEDALARVAENDGQDHAWYAQAIRRLDDFERRSRLLGAKIGEDMPFPPKPRKRKGRRRRSRDPRLNLSRGLRMSHEGGFLPGWGATAKELARDGSDDRHLGDRRPRGEKAEQDRDSVPPSL